MDNNCDVIEQKLAEHREISDRVRELEARKKELTKELLTLLPKEQKKVQTTHFFVSRYQRLSIKTSLEEAYTCDAVKIEKVVDKDRIKFLYKAGTPVPGVSTSEYIVVSRTNNVSPPFN